MSVSGDPRLFRALLKHVHEVWLEATLASVTPEMAAWQPPGRVVPLGALYAHVVFSEDALLAGFVAGRQPLMATEFAGRSGFASPPPIGKWDEWARSIVIDLDALRAYAQAVYAQTDAIVDGLSDADLDRMVDLTHAGMATMPVRALMMVLVAHGAAHAGEISSIKGLQDQRGYAF